MQAPPSHLYYVHWIYRSCSYSETSPIGLQYYHNLMLSDCIMAATFAQVQRQSAEMTWCHDVMVWLSCHLTWSHRGSWTPRIYLITAISIVSDDSSVSVLFDHLLAPAITLSSVQSTLVSALDPLLPPTPGHSQPANCQPRVPVDHSALCPAAAISHPKKPLLLPPPPFSNQQSGVRTVVRCINSAQADLARWTDPWNFTFLAPRSVKNVKSLSKRAKDLN